MYLKSLVLKGFKSFADKSTLTLQPGITAIVGPNGSGKSNISDAVLWVLGERSARNLRGQAMEDIIFSGSAARKAVSVAEVELVLDNSDHVLPVDFDEVAIARRMFRSGESEYLLNGVVARRLDVLDILHDSGLGTGTHSIISQGSLDSILQSKPEDRRALIEEAAGVLKHKRRKEKSARKLEQMRINLDRVRDVTAEVERQLGPLERKAKRAEAYKKASADLAEVKLSLAVDDLRALQAQWEALCAEEQGASADLASRREAVASAERTVNDFQELMRRESEDASAIARQQRRASSLSERLDGAELLVRERKRAADAARAEMTASLEGYAQRRAQAVLDYEDVQAQLAEVGSRAQAAGEHVAELTRAKQELGQRKGAMESELSSLGKQVGACERDMDAAKRRLGQLRESLAGGMAQVKIVEARKQEFELELARAREEHGDAARELDEAKTRIADLEQRDAEARASLATSFEAREAAHARRDEAAKSVRLAHAEIEALEKTMEAARADDPALDWLVRNSARFDAGMLSMSRAFRVSPRLEGLLERMLGNELAALAVRDGRCALDIARALAQGGLSGDVTLFLKDAGARSAARGAFPGAFGRRLLDELDYDEALAPVVEALLGDVVLCASREDAFEAHSRSDGTWRFLSEDGCVVGPGARVTLLGADEAVSEGMIARERKLSDLKSTLSALEAQAAEAQDEAAKADEDYRKLQARSLDISQQLANGKGSCDAAQAEEQRCARRVQNVLSDMEQASKQMEAASQQVEGMQPKIDELAQEVDQLERRRGELARSRRELNEKLSPLSREASDLESRFADARLNEATLAERRTYVERLVLARKIDLEQLDSNAARSRRAAAVKSVAVSRAERVLDVFDAISARLELRVRVLDEALSASEASSSSAHASVAAARDEARKAHDDYDVASARMAQVRVDKGRLEMRVEAAVKVIVEDLSMPLDRIGEVAPLEDRPKAEEESLRLERRIKNMGTINPDAAEEYAQIKARYDFLAGQLADMESARRALSRIAKVIDARMKDDFVRTFDEVNRNFGQVFSELFPGGSAYLSLDDPDDVEHAGVEVTAQPAGKRLTKMMLMSGGEKSLTALALLFAVYKTRATPFYILDEVEAALDDTNLRRLVSYIDRLRDTTQLIMITHQRRTMEMADVLFGVSMHADGVTKVVSQRLERALEHAE